MDENGARPGRAEPATSRSCGATPSPRSAGRRWPGGPDGVRKAGERSIKLRGDGRATRPTAAGADHTPSGASRHLPQQSWGRAAPGRGKPRSGRVRVRGARPDVTTRHAVSTTLSHAPARPSASSVMASPVAPRRSPFRHDSARRRRRGRGTESARVRRSGRSRAHKAPRSDKPEAQPPSIARRLRVASG